MWTNLFYYIFIHNGTRYLILVYVYCVIYTIPKYNYKHTFFVIIQVTLLLYYNSI